MRFLDLTEEAPMVSLPKVVGVLSCGCLLGLGLSLNGFHTIKGEVLGVEPSSYFVKQYDGDELRVHIDDTTQMTGRIGQVAHIEAKVSGENHALSIRSAQ
jgi:hypothetical protein